MTGPAWTASTPIEHAWRGRPDPETPEEFLDWLHAVLRKVRLVGYLYRADGTAHYARFVLRAREAALDVWGRDSSLPDLPPPMDDSAAELLSLWEWAKKALRHASGSPPAESVTVVPGIVAVVRAEIGQLVSELRAPVEEAKSAAETAEAASRKAKTIESVVRRIGTEKVSDEAILAIYDAGNSLRETSKIYSEQTGRKITKRAVEGALERRRALQGED